MAGNARNGKRKEGAYLRLCVFLPQPISLRRVLRPCPLRSRSRRIPRHRVTAAPPRRRVHHGDVFAVCASRATLGGLGGESARRLTFRVLGGCASLEFPRGVVAGRTSAVLTYTICVRLSCACKGSRVLRGCAHGVSAGGRALLWLGCKPSCTRVIAESLHRSLRLAAYASVRVSGRASGGAPCLCASRHPQQFLHYPYLLESKKACIPKAL